MLQPSAKRCLDSVSFAPSISAWTAAWAPSLVFALTVLSGPLVAQFDANLGRIVGWVNGPDGKGIADAEVVVTAVDSRLERTVRSDATGGYQAGSLHPGDYSLTATSPDFAPATDDGITVNVGSAV